MNISRNGLITIISFCLVLCLSSCSYASGTSEQEEMILVPKSKLILLQNKLNQLNQLNQQSLKDWENQQQKLEALEMKCTSLEEKCMSLEKKLLMQKEESEKQEQLLENVNQSFQTYSKEMKAKISREKMQKNIWIGASAILLAGLIVK